MIKTISSIVLAVFLLVGFVFLGWKGKPDDVVQVFTAIATLSGLVFTVAGLWAGFVFPEAIKAILSNASVEEKKKKCKEYGNILIPVLLALVCALMSIAAPIVYKITTLLFPSLVNNQICNTIYSILAFANVSMLLWAILRVITPSIHWFNIIEKRTKSEEAADLRMPKRDV